MSFGTWIGMSLPWGSSGPGTVTGSWECGRTLRREPDSLGMGTFKYAHGPLCLHPDIILRVPSLPRTQSDEALINLVRFLGHVRPALGKP